MEEEALRALSLSLSLSPESHPMDQDSPMIPAGAPPENGKKAGEEDRIVGPPSHLPWPEAPAGLTKTLSTGPDEFRPIERSVSVNSPVVDISSIEKYLHDQSNSFSAAIMKRMSSLGETSDPVTQFHLSGLKVIVRMKGDKEREEEEPNDRDHFEIKGQISFFSKSCCRDCGMVRSFFREKGLPYVEINLDVFPEREKEQIERSGSAAVPQTSPGGLGGVEFVEE